MKFLKTFNATFITLIPKRKGVVQIKDFRPISLLGSVYNMLAKKLTENAMLVANDSLDYKLKKGIIGVVCKLDQEKATTTLVGLFS